MRYTSLIAGLFASLGAAMTSGGQEPLHPFTFDELHKVILFFVEEPRATTSTQSFFAESAPAAIPHPHQAPPAQGDSSKPLAHSGIRGVSFTQDMLVLLSLLSDSTNEKVEAYLRWDYLGRPMDEKERAEWVARREELRNVDEIKEWLRSVNP